MTSQVMMMIPFPLHFSLIMLKLVKHFTPNPKLKLLVFKVQYVVEGGHNPPSTQPDNFQ